MVAAMLMFNLQALRSALHDDPVIRRLTPESDWTLVYGEVGNPAHIGVEWRRFLHQVYCAALMPEPGLLGKVWTYDKDKITIDASARELVGLEGEILVGAVLCTVTAIGVRGETLELTLDGRLGDGSLVGRHVRHRDYADPAWPRLR